MAAAHPLVSSSSSRGGSLALGLLCVFAQKATGIRGGTGNVQVASSGSQHPKLMGKVRVAVPAALLSQVWGRLWDRQMVGGHPAFSPV